MDTLFISDMNYFLPDDDNLITFIFDEFQNKLFILSFSLYFMEKSFFRNGVKSLD